MDDFKRFDTRRLERITRWLPELRSRRNARVAPIRDLDEHSTRRDKLGTAMRELMAEAGVA